MRKEKKSTGGSAGIINIILTSFYLVILLAMVAVLAITFYRTMSDETKVIVYDAKTSFALIITSLTIMFASSIIVPKFMLKYEVENSVEEKLNAVIDKKFDEKFEERVIEKMNAEILKIDAHLSRMIAFFLSNDYKEIYEIWSIGWCFRSLKGYQKLKNIGLDVYNDFLRIIAFVFNRINTAFNTKISGCISKENKNLATIETHEFFSCVRQVIESGNMGDKNDKYRTAFRAIKDAVDFDFDIDIQKKKQGPSLLIDEFKAISKDNGIFIKILLTAYLTYLIKEEEKKDDKKTKEDIKKDVNNHIFEKMCEITSFRDSNTDEDDEARKKFQKSFKNLLLTINEPENQKKLLDLYRTPNKDGNDNHKQRILDTTGYA